MNTRLILNWYVSESATADSESDSNRTILSDRPLSSFYNRGNKRSLLKYSNLRWLSNLRIVLFLNRLLSIQKTVHFGRSGTFIRMTVGICSNDRSLWNWPPISMKMKAQTYLLLLNDFLENSWIFFLFPELLEMQI